MQGKKKNSKAAYMISAVAESYGIHPQTLRLYEREGLLKPSRSDGNTRLYTQEDLERLEVILSLTRELGVNLAGVEVVLNMRKRMGEMQRELQDFIEYVERIDHRSLNSIRRFSWLGKVTPPHVVLAKSGGWRQVNNMKTIFQERVPRARYFSNVFERPIPVSPADSGAGTRIGSISQSRRSGCVSKTGGVQPSVRRCHGEEVFAFRVSIARIDQ
jgi:MerR family transcriptional regulator/heat shock protein HspR